MPGEKFSMLGPEGYVISKIDQEAAKNVKKERPAFLDDDEELEQQQRELEQAKLQHELFKLPAELKCPFGDHIMKDAVLMPCCGHFVCCDECIRHKISTDQDIECPIAGCDQEIGSLSSITPFHEVRKKVAEYLQKMASQKTLAASTGQTSSNDAFFNLLLEDVEKPLVQNLNRSPKDTSVVDKENKPSETASASPKTEFPGHVGGSVSGTESPLQDSKISSSVVAAQNNGVTVAAAVKAEVKSNEMIPLLPSPPTGISTDPTKTGIVAAINQLIQPQNQQQPMLSNQVS
jgi:hypothetical protein